MAGLLILAFFVLPADAQTPTTITAERAGPSRHLASAAGRALYIFEADRRAGDINGSVESACVNECLLLWPPLPGDVLPAAGNGVDARLIGSFRRSDGKTQATYNGRPLYYFAEDFNAGDTNGHHFEEFGGAWYLVTPTGNELGGKIASGVDYQGGEDCVCHGGVAQTLTATRDTVQPTPEHKRTRPAVAKTFLEDRFAWAFSTEEDSGARGIARNLVISASSRLPASTQ